MVLALLSKLDLVRSSSGPINPRLKSIIWYPQHGVKFTPLDNRLTSNVLNAKILFTLPIPSKVSNVLQCAREGDLGSMYNISHWCNIFTNETWPVLDSVISGINSLETKIDFFYKKKSVRQRSKRGMMDIVGQGLKYLFGVVLEDIDNISELLQGLGSFETRVRTLVSKQTHLVHQALDLEHKNLNNLHSDSSKQTADSYTIPIVCYIGSQNDEFL